MTKIRQLTIAVVGLLLINVGLLAFLLVNKPGPPPDAGSQLGDKGPKQVIIEKLDLNPEQIAAYGRLIDGHRNTIQKLTGKVRTTRNKLYATLADDTSGADSLITQLGLLQIAIETTHYRHFAEIRKLCRPNQLGKFRQLTSELSSYFGPPKGPPPPKP